MATVCLLAGYELHESSLRMRKSLGQPGLKMEVLVDLWYRFSMHCTWRPGALFLAASLLGVGFGCSNDTSSPAAFEAFKWENQYVCELGTAVCTYRTVVDREGVVTNDTNGRTATTTLDSDVFSRFATDVTGEEVVAWFRTPCPGDASVSGDRIEVALKLSGRDEMTKVNCPAPPVLDKWVAQFQQAGP
jgi:hypothetical protein